MEGHSAQLHRGQCQALQMLLRSLAGSEVYTSQRGTGLLAPECRSGPQFSCTRITWGDLEDIWVLGPPLATELQRAWSRAQGLPGASDRTQHLDSGLDKLPKEQKRASASLIKGPGGYQDRSLSHRDTPRLQVSKTYAAGGWSYALQGCQVLGRWVGGSDGSRARKGCVKMLCRV